MKTLRHTAIGPVGEKHHTAVLSTRAWNAMRTLTGKDDPTAGDFKAFVISLPDSVNAHGYVRRHKSMGGVVAGELAAFAARNGMREYFERPEGYGLSARAYNIIRTLTKERSPTREDFRRWAEGIPEWTNLRRELKRCKNAGRVVVEELAGFARESGLGEYVERALFWGLTLRAFRGIMLLTEKRDPTLDDFGSWIGGLPAGTDPLDELKKYRRIGLGTTRELVAFAARKGLIKDSGQEPAASEPDYCI